VLRTIEGFAIECSINKVWTSEALAWAVDEAVQVFGGNGYSREFPVERMYRDARITRIYEGTNEINRMIIPTRLMKQSADRFAPDAAQAALGSHPSGASLSPVGEERDFLARTKRLATALLGLASAAYGSEFKDAQEVQAQIADVVIEAFAIESGLVRAEKLAARNDRRAVIAIDAARVYTHEAADRIGAAARQVVAALDGRGGDRSLGGAVQRLTAHGGVDVIAARRRIADAVIDAGKHPF
jgi:butyryl-CoA dehydrogenase